MKIKVKVRDDVISKERCQILSLCTILSYLVDLLSLFDLIMLVFFLLFGLAVHLANFLFFISVSYTDASHLSTD